MSTAPPFILHILVAEGTDRWARRAPARLSLLRHAGAWRAQ